MTNKKEARIDARLTGPEKESLIELAKRKGCDGITSLLRLLAKAKEVKIEI